MEMSVLYGLMFGPDDPYYDVGNVNGSYWIWKEQDYEMILWLLHRCVQVLKKNLPSQHNYFHKLNNYLLQDVETCFALW